MTKKEQGEKVFSTSDLGLAAALSSIGHQIVKTDKPENVVLFLFMDDIDIKEDAQKYYMGNLKVDALKLSGEHKSLRRMIGAYARMEQGEQVLKEHYIKRRDID